ncbi:MAG: hypothetical protein ACI9TH_000868 [Kiritimatiellia bacterium]|jgi:hypothetical protein
MHNLRGQARVETLVEAIGAAIAVTDDRVELEILELEIKGLIAQIEAFNRSLKSIEDAIDAVWSTYAECSEVFTTNAA